MCVAGFIFVLCTFLPKAYLFEEQQCSRFHYEEQLLAKMIRMEHRMEKMEEKIRSLENRSDVFRQDLDGWMAFQGSLYLFSRQELDFFDASTLCKSQGAHVVHVDNLAENNFIKYQLKAFKDSFWWIGVTDIDSEGIWKFDGTGTVATFTDWRASEPSNAGNNEHCCHFHSGFDYRWNDITCSSKLKFICEKGLF